MPTTQILLVRHAEKASTPADDEQRDITPDGERRAAWLGRMIGHIDHPVTAVYTSHHLRTRRTASAAMTAAVATAPDLSAPAPVEVVVAPYTTAEEYDRNVQTMARELADRIRGAARSNDVILVVHHTASLPAIARALRPTTAAPATIDEGDFRQLWCIAIGEREGETIRLYPDPIPDA
jgi:phosphohistidine phosphatase SixA